MEKSTEDTEVQQSMCSPPRRRRSTFFERRESVVPQCSPENKINDDDDGNKIKNEKRLNELSSYYEKLLSEKDQWKREINERRNKYHDLRQHYKLAKNAPSNSKMSCYASLSNEDIIFLQGKPNLSAFIQSQQNFHESVKETVELVKRVNELEDVPLKICEDRINKITEFILENSTVGD